jgi:hypothetical protein
LLYRLLAQKMKSEEKFTMSIDFNHLTMFEDANLDISEIVIQQYQM